MATQSKGPGPEKRENIPGAILKIFLPNKRRKTQALAATLAVTCIIALGGCASKRYFTKPGLTQAEWDRDLAQCQYEARSSTQNVDYGYQTVFGQALDQAFRAKELVELCLKARGYTQKEVD